MSEPETPIVPEVLEPEDDLVQLEADLRRFVGPNADRYLNVWMPLIRGEEDEPSANVWGFMFPGDWLCYRKFYGHSLLLLAFLMALEIVGTAQGWPWFNSPLQVGLVSFGMGIFIGFGVSVWGNRWYLARARRVISQVRASSELSETEKQRLIADAGGIDPAGPVIWTVIWVASWFLTIKIIQEFFSGPAIPGV